MTPFEEALDINLQTSTCLTSTDLTVGALGCSFRGGQGRHLSHHPGWSLKNIQPKTQAMTEQPSAVCKTRENHSSHQCKCWHSIHAQHQPSALRGCLGRGNKTQRAQSWSCRCSEESLSSLPIPIVSHKTTDIMQGSLD